MVHSIFTFPEKLVPSPDQAPTEPAASIANPDSGPWGYREMSWIQSLDRFLQATELPEGGAAELRRLQFLTDSKAERFPLHCLSFSHPWVSTKALQRDDSLSFSMEVNVGTEGPQDSMRLSNSLIDL